MAITALPTSRETPPSFTHGLRGEHQKGIAAFTALLELDPRDPNAHMRGWSRSMLGDRPGALRDLTPRPGVRGEAPREPVTPITAPRT
jgi:hypothetical protein